MSTSVPPPGMPAHRQAESPPPAPPGAPTRRAPRKLLAAVVVAAAVAAVAFLVFGSATKRIVDPVAQAATLSSSTSGYRMHMSMQIGSPSLGSPITAVGDGSFDTRDHSGSMSLAMSLGGNAQMTQALGTDTLRIDEILDRGVIYMKLPTAATAALRGSAKPWTKLDLSKLSGVPGLSSVASNPASSDPSQILQYLRAASDSIVAEGQERVDGFLTTHYRADLNLDRIADALPSGERAAVQPALSALQRAIQVHDIPVDVWVDANRLVRRTQMSMNISLPGGQAMSLVITIDVPHYGPQPAPAIPPPDQVQDLSGLSSAGG